MAITAVNDSFTVITFCGDYHIGEYYIGTVVVHSIQFAVQRLR